MTAPLHVPGGGRPLVHVFRLAVSPEELERLRASGTQGIAALLGVEMLDHRFADLFDASDLAGVGLAGFLIEGSGAIKAQVAADQARLDAVRGPVLVLHARAFGGVATTLRPDHRLTLIGIYAEDVPPVRFDPLPDADARRSLAPDAAAPATPPKSDARVGGMVATVALVLMFAFTALFIWFAG